MKKLIIQELIDYAIQTYGSESDIANDIIVNAMILKKKEKVRIIDAFDEVQANHNEKCQDFKNGLEYFEKCYS